MNTGDINAIKMLLFQDKNPKFSLFSFKFKLIHFEDKSKILFFLIMD